MQLNHSKFTGGEELQKWKDWSDSDYMAGEKAGRGSLNKPSACSPKNLKERELMEVVGTAIRHHIDAVTDLEKRVKAI